MNPDEAASATRPPWCTDHHVDLEAALDAIDKAILVAKRVGQHYVVAEAEDWWTKGPEAQSP